MKKLILKGLGKAKVRRIIRGFIINDFRAHIEYGHKEAFTFPLYQTIDGYGLPFIEDDPFTVGELVEFVGNKI